MKHTVLTPDDYRNMPWKNGLGTTCEIIRVPADDSVPFDWRVSIADIKENGPFSRFDEYTRIINTLEGTGMRLSVDGIKSRDLLKYDPFVFSGASLVESELVDGPIRDFNLIFRTGLRRGRLQWLHAAVPQAFCSPAPDLIIFSVGGLEVSCPAFTADLQAYNSLRVENPESGLTEYHLSCPSQVKDSHCCIIEIY